MDAPSLDSLNEQQRAAATWPNDRALLIIAGAGTGKTNTLAHRVAHLIAGGIDPGRILLLTFTRRAAAEMARRAGAILGRHDAHVVTRLWAGTFHAMANRILRLYGGREDAAGGFTVIDRSDAEDLIGVIRAEMGLDQSASRFPRKETCLAIYSRCVDAQEPVEKALVRDFPWCAGHAGQLKALFKAYTQRKQADNVLDYDDLLLYWHALMMDPTAAQHVRGRFDAVLVDEYQDTNAIQAATLRELCPGGRGLTVVGDDAQSIYSFRAATVENILNFPQAFGGAAVLKLQHNYRSVQPILDLSNAMIALAARRFDKPLISTRQGGGKPRLATLSDEQEQSRYLVGRILEHREAGIALQRQAVLFRAAHHSDALEVELARRNIPFVKYGGLKFLEAAHVKDALAILRLAENPRDSTAAFRVLQLLDGVGPSHARRAIAHLAGAGYDPSRWSLFEVPEAAAAQWTDFLTLLERIASGRLPVPQQVALVRGFYQPILLRRYDQGELRGRDLEQLEQISGAFPSRQALLSDLALDPPAACQDLAGKPLLDEDYLILSTIHSAKGCEWDVVYVIHAADGNIPSDMATGCDEQIEEERRLLYVALTRARDFLEVCFPLRYYHKKWAAGDRHTYAQLTRFIPTELGALFERVQVAARGPDAAHAAGGFERARDRVAQIWS